MGSPYHRNKWDFDELNGPTLPSKLIDKHVGNRARVRRLSLGISQQVLAAKLNLTFQQIQKYEKGINRIGASRLYELACQLGVDVNFFFEGLADGSKPSEQQDEIISAFKAASPRFGARDFVELNKAFQRIQDPKLRRTIIDLFGAIAPQSCDPDISDFNFPPIKDD